MKPFTCLCDIKKQSVFKTKRHGIYSNVIYTFDIESTSLFDYGDRWDIFDYSKPASYYNGIDRIGLMYIWMFGIEGEVYYGRTWEEFGDILEKISDPHITKIIFVHNLSFEFGFLPSLLLRRGWTVDKMLARKPHKPICFTIPELNIQFRCSYCLTNLSLADAAKKYTNVKKAVGDLDYNVKRGYDTQLTEEELNYCKMDIVTLYEIVKHFRSDYGSIYRIPYTQTGEVRRAFAESVTRGYQNRVRKLHEDVHVYCRLRDSFAGGLTHSNRIHNFKIYEDVGSFDISSSYPFAMCRKYPMSRFERLLPDKAKEKDHDRWAILYTVEFHDIECKYFNSYIPAYKAISGHNIKADSGRVFKADMITLCINDVDLDIIRRAYNIGEEKILEAYAAVKDYLPKEYLSFLLELYGQKTTLKGVEGREREYAKYKQMLNSMFGACCFNILKAGAKFDSATGQWIVPTPCYEFYKEKLQELKDSYTHLFTYSWGTYCTSYARERLYNGLITHDDNTDIDSVYYDTDSDKLLNWRDHQPLIDQLNKEADQMLWDMCTARAINFDKTRPKDIKGIEHPLGYFEIDGIYKRFVTLGAKRYAYEDDTGIHITVAGVSKRSGVKALKGNLENFRDGIIFDYEEAGKMIVTYNNEQPMIKFKDDAGNEHLYNDTFGVNLMPTTYTLGVSEEYDALCRWAQEHMQRRY